jgi:mono/diheme cytochrome c family protein
LIAEAVLFDILFLAEFPSFMISRWVLALRRRGLALPVLILLLFATMPVWAQNGEKLFLDNCSGCHGKNGDGKTNYAKKAHVPDLRSKETQVKSDHDLHELIARGLGHVSYPHAFELRGMSSEMVAKLVQYIRVLK